MKLKFYPLVVLAGLLLVCGCGKEKPENKLFPPDPKVCSKEEIEINEPRESWAYTMAVVSKTSQMGCLRTLYKIFNDGRSDDIKDKNDFLLFAAAVAQNEPEVKKLVAQGAKAGMTTLSWAADYGNREITNELLKAEIESEQLWRGTMAVIINEMAPEDIVLDFVQELINRKFDLNYRVSECGADLWVAAKSLNYPRVVQVLEKNGVQPTQNDKNLALAIAARKPSPDKKTKGKPEVVKQLVREGADVNATTKCGKRPIYQDVKELGTPEMVELFKSLGAHD